MLNVSIEMLMSTATSTLLQRQLTMTITVQTRCLYGCKADMKQTLFEWRMGTGGDRGRPCSTCLKNVTHNMTCTPTHTDSQICESESNGGKTHCLESSSFLCCCKASMCFVNWGQATDRQCTNCDIASSLFISSRLCHTCLYTTIKQCPHSQSNDVKW